MLVGGNVATCAARLGATFAAALISRRSRMPISAGSGRDSKSRKRVGTSRLTRWCTIRASAGTGEGADGIGTSARVRAGLRIQGLRNAAMVVHGAVAVGDDRAQAQHHVHAVLAERLGGV